MWLHPVVSLRFPLYFTGPQAQLAGRAVHQMVIFGDTYVPVLLSGPSWRGGHRFGANIWPTQCGLQSVLFVRDPSCVRLCAWLVLLMDLKVTVVFSQPVAMVSACCDEILAERSGFSSPLGLR
jgi:hypothetical protein